MEVNKVKDYLFIHGIGKRYTRWIWHNEIELYNMSCNYEDKDCWHPNNVGLDDQLHDML